MKLGLISLPFVALFIAVLSSAISATNPTLSWAVYAGWGVAAAIIGLWVTLDFEGFKRFFTRKGARYGFSSGLNVFLALALIVGSAFLSTKPRFNKSIDVSKAQVNTLSDQSVKVIRNLEEKSAKVEVTAFFDDQAAKQKFDDAIDRYQRIAEVMKISYFNPRIENTKAQALNLTSANTVIFTLGSREARITEISEEKITNALVNILKDSAKKVYFTKGHGEPALKAKDANGFDLVVQELENNRYEVLEVNLVETNAVPKDADLLVIAGPSYDFNENEAQAVVSYLKSGGAMLMALEAMVPTPVLASIAARCGVVISDDILILPPNDPRARFFGQGTVMVSNFDKTHPITKSFGEGSDVTMLVQNARSLATAEQGELSLKPTIIGKSSAGIVRVKDVKTQNDLKNISQSRLETGEFGVFVAAAGKSGDAAKDAGTDKAATKETRVVISGSAKFASNQGAMNGSNKDMFVNISNYLLQDEDFISIRPKEAGKGTIEVTSGMSQLTLIFISYLYPFLFLFGGIVYWLRRRGA